MRGLPLWRKLITIPILPAIILIWMIGWTLTYLPLPETTENKQTTKLNTSNLQSEIYKTIEDEEEQKNKYAPEIFA